MRYHSKAVVLLMTSLICACQKAKPVPSPAVAALEDSQRCYNASIMYGTFLQAKRVDDQAKGIDNKEIVIKENGQQVVKRFKDLELHALELHYLIESLSKETNIQPQLSFDSKKGLKKTYFEKAIIIDGIGPSSAPPKMTPWFSGEVAHCKLDQI